MLPCKGKTVAAVVLTLCVLGWGTGGTPGTEKPAAKPARRSRASKPPFTREQLQKALESRVKFPGIDDARTTLVETLDRIARRYNVPLDVNEKWFQVDGLIDVLKTEIANPNPIPPMNAPLKKVLRKILARIPASSGATYLVRKETIEITTGTAVRLELGLPAEEEWDPVRDPDGLALLLPPPPRVVFRFEGTPLPEALETVAESADLNVILDPRVKGAAEMKVRARLYNVPADTAVRVLADMAGLRVARRPGVLYVTSAGNAERIRKEEERRRPPAGEDDLRDWLQPPGDPVGAGLPPASEVSRKSAASPPAKPAGGAEAVVVPPDRDQLREALTSTVKFGGFDDAKTTLVDALDQLARRYNVSFDINEKAFAAEKVKKVRRFEIANPDPVPAMNATMETVLEKILSRVPAPSGATYLIRKDHIEVTTGKAVRTELGLDDGALPPLVSEVFEDTPLPEALQEIADSCEVNVVLDPRAEGAAEVRVRARLYNVPVETAVGVLADLGGLGVVRRHNVLYVTTPENAERIKK